MDIKKLEAIVKIEPNNPKHWFNLGIAYIQENRIAEAHKAFEESIKMNPYFAHSQFFAGLLLLFGRDFKNGIKYLEKATTIDDNIYNKLISDHVIKEILINLIKMSLKVIQDQLEFQPNNIENLSTMAKILLYTNSFEASINYFRKIIELRTENWEAYLYLGIAYEGIENYEQALFYLKRAVASNQYLAESYWIMGRIYLKLGNYGLALKNYEKAVELAPNNTRYLNSLARLYLILDKNAQAMRTLQFAIDNNPNSKWSYYYLGQCLEKEYNFDMAIEQYEKAINIDPLFTEAKISLAKIYQLNNNTKRAIEILEELSMDSNDTEIFLLLAQLYYSIGNYIKSKELTEKILSIVPDEKNALHLNILSLLNIYKRKEDIADEEYLIKNLEYLYNNNPSDPVISTELFKLYVDKRDFLKAKEVLEKSKISIKDEETAKKIAFIYLEQENYEKFISTVKYYKLFSFDFIMEIISFLREKGSSFLPIFINDIMQIGKDYLKTDEEIRILLLYLEYIYFSNTLQAWEFYKQRFSEDVKKRYNLYLFELLIYFSLYSEYKDKKYFDSFIELANGLNIEYENMANIEHLSVFSLKVNVTINFVLMFYFIVIKSQYNLIYKLYEFLLSNPDIESNVLNTALSDLLPIFMDNSYYSEVIQIIDNFKLSQISLLKKIRIEALLLLGKNSDVLREVEEYYEKFSYDSYVEIIKIIANFDIYGDIPEHLVNNLEILVQESNPLAFALYAHFLLKTDNNEAKRYAIRSLEFLYTEKHNLKYSYQMKIVINILAKFFESTYQLSVFLKGMKQLVSKYSDNYTFNYLLAKYLYITEDYIDAELVAKKSLKLTKNSSQLLEAQNLLGKIREEKERYQSFINELEKIDSGISEKIAYVNTLYKKERIEEIFKMLNDISNSNSLSDIIIKFYIFDKLEIKEQLIYYLYLLRAFAFENSYENMLEFIENKLMFYSNVEELEEIKQKAEIDYVKILKNYKQSQLEDFETKKEQEIYLEQYTREEDLERTSQGEMNAEELLQIDVGPTIEIFDNQIDITHDQKEELSEVYIEQKKVSLSNVENYDDLQNVIISNSFDLILAGLLKLFYIIFENNQEKIKEIGVMIDNSQIQLGEDDEKIVVLLQNIEEKILLNDVKSLMIDIKNFVQKYSKNRYFSFYISMILAAFNYKIGKTGDFKRHLKYCKENIENYQFLGKLLNMIDKYPGVEEIKEVPISEIKEFANPPYKDEKIVIISPQELILAYFVRILLIVFGHSNYLQDFIDEQLKNLNFVLDDKEHILIEFLQKVIAGLIQNDMKSVLVDVKNFINNNSKDPYFSFYYSLIMVFISYKLKRIDDFKKYLNIVLKAFNKYQNFQNLLSWLERVGDSIENIDH